MILKIFFRSEHNLPDVKDSQLVQAFVQAVGYEERHVSDGCHELFVQKGIAAEEVEKFAVDLLQDFVLLLFSGKELPGSMFGNFGFDGSQVLTVRTAQVKQLRISSVFDVHCFFP